jgi:c-di-GMP-binding flagellar brake protein YcgR
MSSEERLRVGDTFLLRAGKEYFLSTIESVTEHSIEVTVPAKDFPPPGMKVSMDFHDDDGCSIYKTEVIRGPSAKKQSARLRRPGPPERITHREYTRIETDIPVRFREIGTVTFRQGQLINLSAGGALLRTAETDEFHKLLEIDLKLPGGSRMSLFGQIIHKAEQMTGPTGRVSLYGCKFVRLDWQERKTIIQYVREQLAGELSIP